MANMFKKTFAMLTALCMLVVSMPIQALAEEGEPAPQADVSVEAEIITKTDTLTGNEVVITFTPTSDNTQDVNVSGTNEKGADVDMTGEVVTTVDNAAGTTTVDVTLSGTETAGETVKEVTHEETTTETTTETETTLVTVTVNEGTEVKEWTGDGVENIEGAEGIEEVQLPSVEVDLIPGGGEVSETVTGKVEGDIGDVKEGEDDKEYDYSHVEIEADRTVTAEASDVTVNITEITTEYDAPVAPEDYEGKNRTDGYDVNNPQATGLGASSTNIMVKPNQAQDQTNPGDDFYLAGLGEWTDAAAPVFKYIVYEKYEEGDEIPEGFKVGDAKLDADGNKIVDESKSKLIDGSQGKAKETGMDWQPSQLILTYDETGKYFYAYCADYLVETDQEPGHRYALENLEDSGHYTKEDAEKLRAIVLNAYWGGAEGNGSLEQIKQNLLNEYADNSTITVKDKNGNDVSFDLTTLLGDMKEHEALAVTQAAIWAYSINRTGTANKADKLPDGIDDITVVGAQSAIKCYNSKGGALSEYTPAHDQSKVPNLTDEEKAAREAEALESDARMKALFDYLMNLEGISDEDEGVTTIINEKNNFEDVSLVVNDRVADHEANKDSNKDNDVYNVDLKFTLAFVPDEETDDLLVYLYGSDGQVMKDKDGKEIVRRLAGENTEEKSADRIEKAEDGAYVLSGLQLGENTDFTFDLRLEGVQNLKEGVYLYTAEGGRLASQTLVGVATGKRSVKLSAQMTIKFDVDEQNKVTVERHWRNESDPIVEEKEPPVRYRTPGPVIPDEPVPLADVPQTGDISVLWFAMILLSGCGLCALKLFEKKFEA